jgi:hypothetical protein
VDYQVTIPRHGKSVHFFTQEFEVGLPYRFQFALGDFLKRTSLVVVCGGVARTLASPRWGEVHTPSTGRKPGDQGVKTRGEPFPEITL